MLLQSQMLHTLEHTPATALDPLLCRTTMTNHSRRKRLANLLTPLDSEYIRVRSDLAIAF